ncbi:MAG TPA: PQQ-binding-like beta-propeller repeat protein [Rhizomicrobium sp.]|nr:PQQ-binding-like beta-propeller repeat protein [Rhizomicrobium sp.]
MSGKFTRRGTLMGGTAAMLGLGTLSAKALTPLAMQKSADIKLTPLPTQPYDTANGEWRTYGGNLASWRYSALDQIDAANFNSLNTVWNFLPDNLGPRPDPNLQATPLMVKGVLYLTAGTRRAAVALNATTGEMLWKFNIDEGERGRNAPRPLGRGLSYWTDGNQERVLYVTPGFQLISLDAKTGAPDPAFGVKGIVEMKVDPKQDIDPTGARRGDDIGLNATPLVVGDIIVVGAAHLPSTSPRMRHIKGYICGYDIRSGKRLWIYHPMPFKGEPGYDTWLNGSAEVVGNMGNWAQNSADPELGLVYIGTEMPTDDWYGGARHGDNLYGDCITALDVRTGKRVWYYQTTHHDIWDRDIPCAPILCDLTVNGRKVKAIAQPTKQAYLYVLDRVTGKPVWPIPEVRVPKGTLPTEWYSPTQPVPSKPPPFDEVGSDPSRLIDFTPELRAEALKLIANYKTGGMFEPPVLSTWPRPLATISSPTGDGAGQWPGGAFDPETNNLYMFSNLSVGLRGALPSDPKVTDAPMMSGIARNPDPSAPAPASGPGSNRLAVQGMPIFKPPYGRITSYDMNKGEILWQIAHGETPDVVRNNPALKGMKIPRTGSQGKVGILVTKTLIIAGDGTATTDKDGKLGGWLRAYDKKTGKEVGAVPLPGRASGSPMTYMVDGQQYISIACTGPVPGRLVTLKLSGAAPKPVAQPVSVPAAGRASGNPPPGD